MKKVVRDDIIDLITFTKAEFKYIKYLELLKNSGNYCFLSQFKSLIPKGRSIINGMIENNLVKTESINKNYKYIYLTDTAMKFIMLRSSDKDFSTQSKKSISVKKVSKYPSEKQLLSSAYKFHMLVNGENSVNKEYILENIINKFYEKNIQRYISGVEIKNLNKSCMMIKDTIEDLEKQISKEKEDINLLKNMSIKLNLGRVVNLDKSNDKLREITLELNSLEKEVEEKEKSSISRLTGKKDILYIQSRIKQLNEFREFIELENENKRNCICKYTEIIKSKESNIKGLIEKKDYQMKIIDYIEKAKKEVDDTFSLVRKKIENLYDISKIIVKLENNILEFIILDTGSLKTAKSYNRIINSLKEDFYELELKKIEVKIYSYAENRARNLEKEFLKIKKEESVVFANKSMRKESKYRREILRKANERVNNNIFYGDVSVNSECYYLGAYKEIDSSKKYIKLKDVKAIEELIDRLI